MLDISFNHILESLVALGLSTTPGAGSISPPPPCQKQRRKYLKSNHLPKLTTTHRPLRHNALPTFSNLFRNSQYFSQSFPELSSKLLSSLRRKSFHRKFVYINNDWDDFWNMILAIIYQFYTFKVLKCFLTMTT